MAKIQAPNWCKDAIPTERGWERNGELLVARKHRQDELDEYFGVSQPVVEEPAVVEEEVEIEVELLTEAPISNVSLADMTKAQLLALANDYGLDLKSWMKKDEIVESLNEVM